MQPGKRESTGSDKRSVDWLPTHRRRFFARGHVCARTTAITECERKVLPSIGGFSSTSVDRIVIASFGSARDSLR